MKFIEMGRAYLSATLLLFLAVPCIAFTNGSNTDTLNNKPNVKFAFRMPMFDFSIQDAALEGEKIDYTANVPLTFGASFHYKSFGISASKEMTSSLDTTYGSTKYTDVQLYYYSKKFGYELYFQKYKGYYLDASDKFGYTLGDSNSIRPDINTQHFGFNVFYTFSKQYSINALLSQDERLKKWDWSFLVLSSYNQVSINSSKNLIPEGERIHYGNNSDYRGGKYNVVSVAAGLALNVPYHKFYASAVGFGGYGLSFSENHYFNEVEKLTEPFIKVIVKFSLGYYGNHIFTGMSASLDGVTPIKEGKKLVFQTNSGYVELFLGYRF